MAKKNKIDKNYPLLIVITFFLFCASSCSKQPERHDPKEGDLVGVSPGEVRTVKGANFVALQSICTSLSAKKNELALYSDVYSYIFKYRDCNQSEEQVVKMVRGTLKDKMGVVQLETNDLPDNAKQYFWTQEIFDNTPPIDQICAQIIAATYLQQVSNTFVIGNRTYQYELKSVLDQSAALEIDIFYPPSSLNGINKSAAQELRQRSFLEVQVTRTNTTNPIGTTLKFYRTEVCSKESRNRESYYRQELIKIDH